MTGIAIWASCFLPMLAGGFVAGLSVGWLIRGHKERRNWIKKNNAIWR